jgi:hypothetical protein
MFLTRTSGTDVERSNLNAQNRWSPSSKAARDAASAAADAASSVAGTAKQGAEGALGRIAGRASELTDSAGNRGKLDDQAAGQAFDDLSIGTVNRHTDLPPGQSGVARPIS